KRLILKRCMTYVIYYGIFQYQNIHHLTEVAKRNRGGNLHRLLFIHNHSKKSGFATAIGANQGNMIAPVYGEIKLFPYKSFSYGSGNLLPAYDDMIPKRFFISDLHLNGRELFDFFHFIKLVDPCLNGFHALI